MARYWKEWEEDEWKYVKKLFLIACIIFILWNICVCEFDIFRIPWTVTRSVMCYMIVSAAFFAIVLMLRDCCCPMWDCYWKEVEEKRLEKERKIKEANMSDEEKAEIAAAHLAAVEETKRVNLEAQLRRERETPSERDIRERNEAFQWEREQELEALEAYRQDRRNQYKKEWEERAWKDIISAEKYIYGNIAY